VDFSQSYWHLAVFAVLFLAGLVLVIWQAAERASSFALASDVIQAMDAVVVVSAAVAILSVDGTKMFAESFLAKRYQDGLKVGLKEGLREGRKEERQRLLEDLVKLQLITEEQRRELEDQKKLPT